MLKRIIYRIFGALWWTAVALLLFVIGAVIVLYSSWFQDVVRAEFVERVNATQDVRLRLDRLEVDFPLEVTLEGLEVVEPGNDTLVAARKFYASVDPLPLLKGEIAVEDASLTGAYYRLGSADSAMYMRISATDLALAKSMVMLSSHEIDLTMADIDGGRIDMVLREDSTEATPVPSDSTQSAQWKINVLHLNLTDFGYNLSIEESIDSLGAHFAEAAIDGVTVDLSGQTVNVKSLDGDNLSVACMASAATSRKGKDDDGLSSPSKPWVVMVDTISLSHSKALYSTTGVKPKPGMDFGYIEVDSIDLEVRGFYNEASDISVPITKLDAVERCGLSFSGRGEFAMFDDMIRLEKFELSTSRSHLNVDGLMGIGDDASGGKSNTISFMGNGYVGVGDVVTIFPQSRPMVGGISMGEKINIEVDVDGSMNRLTVGKLYAALGRKMELTARGQLAHVADFDKMSGSLKISGSIADAGIVNRYLKKTSGGEVVLPAMKMTGDVAFDPKMIKGDVKAVAKGGNVEVKGLWNGRTDGYDVDIAMSRFPVDAFMPRLGVGTVTGDLVAHGQGFDPFDNSMKVAGESNISSVEYNGVTYNDLYALVNKTGLDLEVELTSLDERANLDLVACCRFDPVSIRWDMNADVRNFDLGAFDLDAENSTAKALIYSAGYANAETRVMLGKLRLEGAEYNGGLMSLALNEVDVKAMSTDSATSVSLRNDDLLAYAGTTERLNDTLAMKFVNAAFEAMLQVDSRKIDVELIQQCLPQFNLDVRAGSNNALARFLSDKGHEFSRMRFTLSNDSAINLSANVLNYRSGTTAIDTLVFTANQYDKILMYNASMGNRKGTLDAFAHVDVEGYLADDLVSAHLTQRNISGEQGYDIGAMAQVGESVVTLELFPETPTIGYKTWTINDENFIEYNMDNHHVDADVSMTNATSEVRIYTEHSDSATRQEDVIIKIKDLKLSEWLAFNPYGPPVKGDVSADMRVNWDGGEINGDGVVSLDELYYGRERVGTFAANVGLMTNKEGKLKADARLMVDGTETVTIAGILNDEENTSPMMLDFSMIHFPLKVVNPLLPRDVATLSGALNGSMRISGDKVSPVFNGVVGFDDAVVVVDMIGTPLRLSDNELEVVDNIVSIKDFSVLGVNDNALDINGTVDIADMTSPVLDLTFKARDMQIVGSNKSKKADVYGKGFVDIDAEVEGDLSLLDVEATVNLLPGSNVTYIMPDATSSLASYNVDDMVRFVSFADTVSAGYGEHVSDEMAMAVDATIIVSEGTTINVDLSTDGKNRVQLQGNGTLNYTLDEMNDDRFTGRYTINKGFVRYTPPLMSEKLFNFKEGSYVAFTGDMMNPTLSLAAVDDIKANVTQEGQDSRLINFDVEVSVTNTLSNMSVAFDLSTPDDITIANELSSMSAEQRANQAMNMLLYNVYTGPGAKANTNLSGNPLYAFVESKVNSWVANNVKFVDISFGIDQYDKTIDGSTTTATSYSYKVSKTLFDDRFKIVVGGNYSTDADADENYSQNLINDISFEYMLNRSGSMFVKLFRQVGYESILEGEVVQTGVGFVYKRKLKSLRDIFRK